MQSAERCSNGGRENMSVIVTSIDYILNWSRANSLWPLTFATSCCGIEMMQTVASDNDIARFGSEVFRGSPRQADLLICAGTITYKMAPVLQRLYEQMAEPKYVIAMGACTCGGGMFCETSYSVVNGIDKIIPVDIYLPMCPPRPEALLDAIRKLQNRIKKESILKRKEFLNSHDLKLVKKEGMMDWDKFIKVFADCELDGNKIIINSRLHDVIAFVKDNYPYDILKEIIAVHKPDGLVELIYHLYSTVDEEDLLISISVKDEAETITDILSLQLLMRMKYTICSELILRGMKT